MPLMVALRPVRLSGMPVGPARASEAHVDAMLAAAEAALATDDARLTTALALTVRSLTEEYSDLSESISSTLEAAEAAGEATVDFAFEAPLTVASAAETWLRLLEHLEDLAAAGEFEHERSSPDVQAYRRWLVREVVDQLRDGRDPVPFADAHAGPGA